MLQVIGFIIVWPIACTILGMLINLARARSDFGIVDRFTFFMQGFAFGPFGIIASLSPEAKLRGTSTPLFWGGISGSICAYIIYTAYIT